MANNVEILLLATDRASGTIKNVTGALGNLGRHGVNALTPLSNLITTIGANLASQAITNGIRSIFNLTKDTFGTAIDVEQKYADINAVMQLNTAEAAAMQNLIKDLGLDPKLKVTGVEAASVVEMLGKNGVTAEQQLGGLTRGVVLLSNATGGDFVSSAAIATDVMAAFKIGVEDSDRAINGIVGTLNVSKWDLDDYRLFLAQGGGAAAAFGVSIEDANAILAASAPLFGSGSDAGTSYKVMLQRLVPDGNKARDMMRGLGLFTGLSNDEFKKQSQKLEDVRKELAKLDPTSKNYQRDLENLTEKERYLTETLQTGQNAFFDSNGSIKDATEMSRILRDATKDLSDEQRIAAFETIFGTDAMRMAIAIADAGPEKINEYKAAIGNTNAEEMAAIRMDTLRGKMEIFGGVIETLQILVGETFIPMFKDMTDAATAFLLENKDRIVAWFTKVADAIAYLWTNWGRLTTVFEDGSSIIGGFLERLGMGEEISISFGAAIVSFTQSLSSFWDGIAKLIDPISKLIGGFVSWKDVLIAVGIVAGATIVSILAAIAPAAALFAGLIAVIALLRTAWENDWGGIQEKTKTVMDYIGERFGPLVETIRTFGADALKEISAFVTGNETEFTALGAIWDAVVPKARAWLGQLWVAFSEWVTTNTPIWVANFVTWAHNTWVWLQTTAVPQVGIWLANLWTQFLTWYDINSKIWYDNMAIWAAESWEWLRDDVLPNVKKYLAEWAGVLWDKDKPGGRITDWFETRYPAAVGKTLVAWETFKLRYSSLADAIMGKNVEIQDSFKGLGEFWGRWFAGWGEVVNRFRDVFVFILSEMVRQVLGNLSKLMGYVEVIVRVSKGDFQGALDAWRAIDPAVNAVLPEVFDVQGALDQLNAAINTNLNAITGGMGSAGPQYITPTTNTTNNFSINMQGGGQPANDVRSTVGTLQMMYATP